MRGRWQRFKANPNSHRLGSLKHLGCAARNKQLSRPIDKPRDRMDTLAPHTNELLQDGQVAVAKKRVVSGPSPLAINKPPILIDQLWSGTDDKGVVVGSGPELINQYRRFIDRERARATEDPFFATATCPSCSSSFVWGARASILSRGLSTGRESCSLRVAQPRCFRDPNLGSGVCFEALPSDPALSGAVRRLCRELGYFGIFEVEFLWFDGRGRQSTSTRGFLIRLGWTSAEVCRFRF